jgi:hypothetical protein
MNTNQSSLFRVVYLMFGARRQEIITVLGFACLFLQTATAAAPDWWATQNVFAVGAVTDDYAVANVGQLKSMAKKASLEMQSKFAVIGGAGAAIDSMINAWESAPAFGTTRDDYAALTVGQLKQVSAKFYDRISAQAGEPSAVYPWTGSLVATDDYALVNVGQLKAVFAFDIVLADSDQDGLLDVLEMQFFGNLGQIATGDFDGDGLSNLAEMLASTRPDQHNTDEDGDGLTNTQELALGTSPFLKDTDGDGVDDNVEITQGTNPTDRLDSVFALTGLRVSTPLEN